MLIDGEIGRSIEYIATTSETQSLVSLGEMLNIAELNSSANITY